MSYANITVLGNVGAKPIVRTVGDTQGASFNIAVTEKYKTRTGQNARNNTLVYCRRYWCFSI